MCREWNLRCLIFTSKEATLPSLLWHALSTMDSVISTGYGTWPWFSIQGQRLLFLRKASCQSKKIARLLSQLLACVKRLGLMGEAIEGKLFEREGWNKLSIDAEQNEEEGVLWAHTRVGRHGGKHNGRSIKMGESLKIQKQGHGRGRGCSLDTALLFHSISCLSITAVTSRELERSEARRMVLGRREVWGWHFSNWTQNIWSHLL